MRWFALLVLLLATVAIHCDDEVEATEAVEEGSGESEETPKQEEVDNWEDDGVMVLSADNFEEFIKENEFVLVEFYAPWCGHCKSFAPEYVKIATQLEEQSSPIKVVKVDATKDSKYTADYGVRGYPTLKLFRRGLQSHTDFWGPKDTDKILSWLNKKTGPPAVDIKNVEAAEELIKSQNVAILGFFDDYESEEAKAFLKAADAVDDYRSGITKNPEVYKKYEAESGSIILLKNFDEGKAVFDGEYTEQEIQKFIAVYAAPIIIDFNTKFTHIIFSVVRSHVLLFISKEDGHWEDLIQPLKAVAEHYRGEIVFIAIDADVSDHQRILDFFYITDTSIPTLRFVHFADGNNNKYKMKNDDLSPESVKAFIEDGIAGKLRVEVKSEKIPEDWDKAPVKVLVGDNFEDVALDVTKDVFVSFYSPWSEDSKKLAPIIDELGEKYKDSETVVIAKFDAALNELDPKYPKIDTYPTLRLYQKGDNEVSYYTGQLSVEAFVKFIESGGEEITPIDIKETDDNTEDGDKSEDENKSEDVEEEEEADEVEYTFEDDEQSEGKDEL